MSSSDGPRGSADERVHRAYRAVARPRPKDDRSDWFAPPPTDQPGFGTARPPGDLPNRAFASPPAHPWSTDGPEPSRARGTAGGRDPRATDQWRGTGASTWPRPADRLTFGSEPGAGLAWPSDDGLRLPDAPTSAGGAGHLPGTVGWSTVAGRAPAWAERAEPWRQEAIAAQGSRSATAVAERDLDWDGTLDGLAGLGGLGLAETTGSLPRVEIPEPAEPRPEEVAAPARRRRRHPVKHPVRLALYCLVLVGLVAGTAAWTVLDKTVRLTVDGEARSLHTYASTVGGVLDDARLAVTEHDVLAPSRETRISDGAEIVLRRGRLLKLTVDGKVREIWVTATTVQEALDQIGYRQSGLFVSSSRSSRLPLDGFELTLRTPKTVTVVADGHSRRLVTTAPTVGAALQAAGVTLDADDRVSQLAAAPVVNGMTITVSRVVTRTTTTRTVLEYKTVEKEDPNADPGSRTVATKGVNGVQETTYVETYVDGKLASRKVAKVTVVVKPVDEVVVLGPPAAAQPAPAQPAGCADFPTTGGLNWCGLAKCESGLDPAAYNPAGPYYGLYQFDIGTWTSNGGTGLPSEASVAEQTRVAYNLYLARGRSPWPVCGQYL